MSNNKKFVNLYRLWLKGHTVAELADRIEGSKFHWLDECGRYVLGGEREQEDVIYALKHFLRFSLKTPEFANSQARVFACNYYHGVYVICELPILSRAGWWESEYNQIFGITAEDDLEAETLPENNTFDSTDDDWSTAFDPLPLSGIAKTFPIIKGDEQQNLLKWRNHANKASRNGLNIARVKTGKGKAESTFDPVRVGEWLIEKGDYSREVINRKLANNLPPRSAHLKDIIQP